MSVIVLALLIAGSHPSVSAAQTVEPEPSGAQTSAPDIFEHAEPTPATLEASNPEQPPIVGWINLGLVLLAPFVLFMLWRADVIRPGSFKRLIARGGGRDPSPGPAWKWILAIVAGFIAANVGGAVGFFVTHQPGIGGGGDALKSQAIPALLSYSVGIPCLALAFVSFLPERAVMHRAGLRASERDLWTGLWAITLAIPVLAATSAISIILWTSLTGKEAAEVAHETITLLLENRGNLWAIAIMVITVIGAPIFEELLFRMGLQSAVLKFTGSRWLAIAFTSVLFATAHIGSVESYGLLTLFVCGLAFGIGFERTGRIGVPIAMHAIFNAANLALAYTIS